MFMKLQEASKKEVKRIATGSCICCGLELVGFFFLHLLGVVRFTYKVVLGAVGGTVVAILGFVILCLAVQKAVDTQDEKLRKHRMQLSYNLRLLLQAGWVVVAFLLPYFNVLAAAVPLLFPTVIIFYLQQKGRLVTPSERKNPDPSELDGEDEDDHLGSFEI